VREKFEEVRFSCDCWYIERKRKGETVLSKSSECDRNGVLNIEDELGSAVIQTKPIVVTRRFS